MRYTKQFVSMNQSETLKVQITPLEKKKGFRMDLNCEDYDRLDSIISAYDVF